MKDLNATDDRRRNADHPWLGQVLRHRSERVSHGQALENVKRLRVKPLLARKTWRWKRLWTLIKANATAKFDETIEIAMNLWALTRVTPTRWCAAL
jgi:hypothetical protein